MEREDKRDERKPDDAREAYEPPAVVSEDVFETLALTCSKTSGFPCSPLTS